MMTSGDRFMIAVLSILRNAAPNGQKKKTLTDSPREHNKEVRPAILAPSYGLSYTAVCGSLAENRTKSPSAAIAMKTYHSVIPFLKGNVNVKSASTGLK